MLHEKDLDAFCLALRRAGRVRYNRAGCVGRFNYYFTFPHWEFTHEKTRVVVIGAGAIAQRRHLPEYAGRKDVELVGLVDINKPRAATIAEKFGVPEIFTDYRDALKLGPTPSAYARRTSTTPSRPSPPCAAGLTCCAKSRWR